MKWKGIVLAGGSGSRLYPITMAVSKQLLPVYNKPLIYYPLSVLMKADIRDILIITTPSDQGQFIRLLGDGSRFGLTLSYALQERPNGLAEAFIIARDWVGNNPVALVLGDNIFYGHALEQKLQAAKIQYNGATIFAVQVHDPNRFGVIGFDAYGKVDSIEEKPITPRSNYAVSGLYFYDNSVLDLVKELRPSSRGELEITDINTLYLDQGRLHVQLLDSGFAWLDAGSYDSLIEAQHFVQVVEKRHNTRIACLEAIAFEKGWISRSTLLEAAKQMEKTSYGDYLKKLGDGLCP